MVLFVVSGFWLPGSGLPGRLTCGYQGVSLEEAAKNAEKYRVKGKQCTPTNPADCTARYNQMLDPRAGRTKEELEAKIKELRETVNARKAERAWN